MSITSLGGLKQAMEKMFQDGLEAGMVTVKTTIAYSRELHFREIEQGEAAADFEALMRGERKAPEGFRRSEEEAVELGRMLLHDNPAKLFSPRR